MTETGVAATAPDGKPPIAAGEVERRMAKGALWMVLARTTDRSMGLVSTAILARLLVADDFGLVAMATAVLALLELIASFGFDVALIQNTNASRQQYDTAWTFNVFLGASIGLLLLLLAVPAAHFYNEPRLTGILSCLALAAAVQGFENFGVVAFRKALNFNNDFALLFSKRLATFSVTIPIAFALRNYWALVAGILVGRIASVGLTYWLHPYRPRFSLAGGSALLHFGKWLVVGNVYYFV